MRGPELHRRRCGRDARGCLVNNAGESHSATAPSLWKRAAKEATGRLLVNGKTSIYTMRGCGQLTTGQTEIRIDSGFFADWFAYKSVTKIKREINPGNAVFLYDPRIASNFTPGNCNSGAASPR